MLVGAIALVLVPEGVERLPQPRTAVLPLLIGGVVFMFIGLYQAKRYTPTPQFSAMAADFLPESLALGGMFAANASGAVLLALLISLQNLPEGFNAWRELSTGKVRRRNALALILLLPLFGPICALAGWFWLAEHDGILGSVMLFAAGGILYLTFQDIAPQSRLERRWAPPLGAVVGFAFALMGNLLI